MMKSQRDKRTYVRCGLSAMRIILASSRCCVAVTWASEVYQTVGKISPLDLSAFRERIGIRWAL